MKILMRNIGMTLHVIHKLRERGITNVQVNMDWQHLIMNGESLGEYAAMLAAEGLLGHQHANSGWGTFDDDNMVGATAFMETLELAVELRRARYGEQRRAPRLRPLPVHRGRRRRRRPERQAVELHLGGLGPHRRRGAARGAVAQGRRPRLRARVRSARRLTRGNRSLGLMGARAGRARRRHDWRQGARALRRRRGAWRPRRAATRSRRRVPDGRSRIRRTGGAPREAALAEVSAGRRRRGDRPLRPDARPRRARRRRPR